MSLYKRIAVPVDVYESLLHLRSFVIVSGTDRFPLECRPRSSALGAIVRAGVAALMLAANRNVKPGNARKRRPRK
jgi:hypothetical protein